MRSPGNRRPLIRRIADAAQPSGEGDERTSTPRPKDANEALLDAYSQAVVRVVQEVAPAVVGIRPARREDGSASGSGFIISPDGLLITNSHVTGRRPHHKASTAEGDLLDAQLIGDDPATDLALLRINARDLPMAQLGDSEDLKVGQLGSQWEIRWDCMERYPLAW